MYYIDKKNLRLVARRSIQNSITFFSIGGLILLGVCRSFLQLPNFQTAGALAFFIGSACVSIPITSRRKMREFASTKYEFTLSCLQIDDSQSGSRTQVLLWSDVKAFDISTTPQRAHVTISGVNGSRIRISNADLFTSDDTTVPLTIAAAHFLSRGLMGNESMEA